MEEYPVPQRPRVYSELLNGVRYNVAEIKKVAIFPSKAGKITISPLVLNVDLVVQRRRSRRSRSLFDDFFDNPFGQFRQSGHYFLATAGNRKTAKFLRIGGRFPGALIGR